MSQTTIRVVAAPPRPLLVYDGKCNFCARWVRRWQSACAGAFDTVPLQDPTLPSRFPELSREQFQKAVHFITPEGTVFTGAEAVFEALGTEPPGASPFVLSPEDGLSAKAGRRAPGSLTNGAWLLDWYRHSPAFARVAETTYEVIARHRVFFSFLTRLFYGRQIEPPSYMLVRGLFVRALGLVYLAAFLSLWPQIASLIGSQGILPAEQTMAAVRSRLDLEHVGFRRYHLFPTLCWMGAGDNALKLQCGAGAVIAGLLVAGVAPPLCLVLLWVLYLSLTVVAREFLGFQWDNLLLQTGLFAIFVAPWEWLPHGARAPPPRYAMWLLRWLLFQLMFESGCVKLLSHDPVWRDLTALAFHYETQPLPTWIGWYAFQIPLWFQKACCVVLFVIELGLPFLIFAPRRPRQFACIGFVLLQVCIMATGNYCFFNFLTLALCLPLLDDTALLNLGHRLRRPRLTKAPCAPLEGRVQETRPTEPQLITAEPTPDPIAPGLAQSAYRSILPRRLFSYCGWLVTGTAVLTGVVQLALMFGIRGNLPRPVGTVFSVVSPLRSFNNYGLFAVMTTSRAEIRVEGSQDGVKWETYEFKYKPGPLNRRPGFVAPYQPRLDWQMWFAALSDYRHNPWFINFCEQLLQGSPSVLGLLERDPFAGRPPRYIRATLYEYRFTSLSERKKTGDWWARRLLGRYLPTALRSANARPN